MLDLLRGLYTSPWIVGLCRGVVEAVLMAGLLYLAGALASTDVPAALVPFIPILLAGIRFAEGVVDHIDPAKQRAPDA